MRFMTFAPAVVITLAGFFVAWQFVNPAPPRTIVIATGQPDGAYFQFAERYRELLKRRAKFEPVAYILQRKEFFSLDFRGEKKNTR